MDIVFHLDIWFSLFTLIALEVVLGVDNLVFISIASARLPLHQQDLARKIGLSLALVSRLLFLSFMFWLSKLHEPLMTVFSHPVSIRDLIFLLGGGYLLFKGFEELKHMRDLAKFIAPKHKYAKFIVIIFQIMLFDIIFSIDSVITAIGIARHFWVMVVAVVVAILAMILASGPLSHWVEKYPRVKVLAVCFLIFIGLMLLSNGIGFPIPNSYLYVSMVIAILVQVVNTVCML